MGAIGGLGSQSGVNDLGDAFVLVGSGAPGAQLIVQSLETVLEEAFAPLADGGVGQTHPFGDGRVCHPLGAGEHDLCTLDQAVGQGAGVSEAQELGFLIVIEQHGGDGTATRHGQNLG